MMNCQCINYTISIDAAERIACIVSKTSALLGMCAHQLDRTEQLSPPVRHTLRNIKAAELIEIEHPSARIPPLVALDLHWDSLIICLC
jgi:hypothetical protein